MPRSDALTAFLPTELVVDHDLGDNCTVRQTPNGFGPVRHHGRDTYDLAQRTAKRLARNRWNTAYGIKNYATHLQQVAADVYRGRGWPSLDEQARDDVAAVLADMYRDDAFNASKSALRDEIIASLTAQSVAA